MTGPITPSLGTTFSSLSRESNPFAGTFTIYATKIKYYLPVPFAAFADTISGPYFCLFLYSIFFIVSLAESNSMKINS
jgi:hypothetical protein